MLGLGYAGRESILPSSIIEPERSAS
jgi:hypothetical protein